MSGVTEAEALTKWCPFARTVEKWPDGVSGVRNRVAEDRGEGMALIEGLAGTMCLGSACMAWQWTGEAALSARNAEVDLAVAVLGAPEDRRKVGEERAAEAAARRLGYCGLAGAPT